jgi:hypothetical protein
VIDGPWSEDIYKEIASNMMPAVVRDRAFASEWKIFCAQPHIASMFKAKNGLWNAFCVFWEEFQNFDEILDNAFKSVTSKVLSRVEVNLSTLC